MIKECEPFVMQPIMSMELNVPNEYSGPVLSDLTNYRKGECGALEQIYYFTDLINIRYDYFS